MARSAAGGAGDFNTKIIEEFRANGGRVGGTLAGTPMVAQSPDLGKHQARTTRQIPVFMLTRQD
jgi:hypothetical protein